MRFLRNCEFSFGERTFMKIRRDEKLVAKLNYIVVCRYEFDIVILCLIFNCICSMVRAPVVCANVNVFFRISVNCCIRAKRTDSPDDSKSTDSCSVLFLFRPRQLRRQSTINTDTDERILWQCDRADVQCCLVRYGERTNDSSRQMTFHFKYFSFLICRSGMDRERYRDSAGYLCKYMCIIIAIIAHTA